MVSKSGRTRWKRHDEVTENFCKLTSRKLFQLLLCRCDNDTINDFQISVFMEHLHGPFHYPLMELQYNTIGTGIPKAFQAKFKQ
jgi:hypothetical protein